MAYTLLLADDSVTIQRVIELTFADEDVRVVAVSDGDQAIAAIDQRPPDIVLADVGMPGRDGYQVAKHVKTTPRLAHIPVVLLTGAFEPIDQARATEAGCDGVLAKPFEPQLVIGRVKELLAKRLPAAAPSPAPHAVEAPRSPQVVDMPLVRPSAPAAPPASDNFFDRLDEALANLTGTREPSATAGAGAPANEAMDWFSAPAPARTPATHGQPAAPPVHEPAAAPAQFHEVSTVPEPTPAPLQAPTPAAAPAPPQAPVQLPPLAEAFAALLAAEEGAPAPRTAPSWPGQPSAAPDTGDLAEVVTRRVLEQLSDRVVRETVAGIVADVAERLVREEIERIRKSVK